MLLQPGKARGERVEQLTNGGAVELDDVGLSVKGRSGVGM
jgi:hypothetical protein